MREEFNGAEYLFEYDAHSLVTRPPHVGTEESITERILDNNNNLTGLIDPNGSQSGNIFDAEDRLIESTHRENGVSIYTYDTNDRITEVVVPNGVATTYTYDALGRRLTESSPDRGLLASIPGTVYLFHESSIPTRIGDKGDALNF